jgi:hypothetical protein
MPPPLRREVGLAFGSVLSGVVIAAVLASGGSFFVSNFLWYWVPQACVLILLWLLKARPATFAGVAIALALYLGAFGWWLFSRGHPESLAWLGYLFSLPGAAIAAVSVALWLRGRRGWGALLVGSFAAGAVLVGIIVNQAIVCSTVMYCGAN